MTDWKEILSSPELKTWLLTGAHILFASCYFLLFLATVYFMRMRSDARRSPLFYLGGFFLLLSAVWHGVIFWEEIGSPVPGREILAAGAALFFIAAVLLLWKAIPGILSIPGTARLHALLQKQQALVNEMAAYRKNARDGTAKHIEGETGWAASLISELSQKEDSLGALAAAVERICTGLRWDYGEVWIPRADGSMLEYGPAWRREGKALEEFHRVSRDLRFPGHAGLAGRVWATGRPEWVERIAPESGPLLLRGPMAAKAGLHSALACPVTDGRAVRAVLVFFKEKEVPRDEKQIHLVSCLGFFLGTLLAKQEACQRLEEAGTSLINSVDAIIYEYDVSRRKYTFVSEKAAEILEYPAELWLVDPEFWQDHIHGSDREHALRCRAAASAGESGAPPVEYRMITSGGRVKWFRDMMKTFRQGEQEEKIRGIMMDITAAKQLETSLREENDFACAVIDTAGALVLMLDSEGRIKRFNREFERITGRPHEEIMEKYLWDFLPPGETERIRPVFARLLAGQFPSRYESLLKGKDGTRMIAWTSTVLDRKDGTVHVVATGMDTTSVREKEAEARLKAMDEMRSGFISAASHKLRTPLTSVKGYVETILQGEAGPMNEQQREFLERVKESTDRLHRILARLLDIFRIEAGQIKMNMELTNIRDLLKEEFVFFKEQADEKKIALSFESPEGLRDIHCDPERMREVMDNLIHNALKYTPLGGSIRICAAHEADGIRIDIEDTGIGIREEDQARIFEPFHSIEKQGFEDEESTELDLALVKKIVEAHSGKLRLKSRPGKGSTFSVIIPFREAVREGAGGQPFFSAVGHE